MVNNINICNGDVLKFIYKNYHIGDKTEVIANVICPPDIKCKYAILKDSTEYHDFNDKEFETSNKKILNLEKMDINSVHIIVAIKSDYEFYRYKNYDDCCSVILHVLPNKF